MEIFKVSIIGVIGAILAISIKPVKNDFASYISFGTCIVILFYVVCKLSGLVEQLVYLFSYIDYDGRYINILLKMIGITYLCEFCSSICKDAGYQAIGSQIDIFGKITILLAGIPILMTLLETIQDFAV